MTPEVPDEPLTVEPEVIAEEPEEQPASPDPDPAPVLEEEQAPEEAAEEEDTGIAAIFQRFFSIFLALFGLSDDDPEPAPLEQVDERLDAVEVALSDVVPTTVILSEDRPAANEDDLDELDTTI